MMRNSLFSCMAAFVLALPACSKATPAGQAQSEAPAGKQPSNVVPPMPSDTAAPRSVDLRSLAGKLAEEAANRPAIEVTAETVWGALGANAPRARQYLGLTTRASYCAGGQTELGTHVAVCEYPTADAALAGKAYVESTYGAIAGRRIELHGATSLTVVANSEAQQRQADAIQQTFRNL